MQTELKAAKIIREAEAKLRSLLTEAAAEGEYNIIVKVAGWARWLGELVSDMTPAEGSAQTIPAVTSDSQASLQGKAPNPPRRQKRSKAYPKFFRNGENLVKIGWSKAQRTEYEHKAPLSVLSDLAAAISAASAKRPRLTMESILPLKCSRDGTEVPSYQTYLCLAWLRKQGLVLQHGRQGYSVRPKADLPAKTRELVQLLPEQRFENNQKETSTR
jgi:hypothetical protein